MGEAPTPLPTTRVKGLAFRSVLRWYEEHFGHAQLVACTLQHQPWLEEHLDLQEQALGIMVNRWYSTAITEALAQATTADMTPETFETFSAGSSEWIVRDTVRGLYRLLFDWIATPTRFVKYRARVWASYYDHGSFELIPQGPRQIEVQIRDWAGYHPLIFALTRKVILMMFDEMGCKTEDQGALVEEGPEGLNAFTIAWVKGATVDLPSEPPATSPAELDEKQG